MSSRFQRGLLAIIAILVLHGEHSAHAECSPFDDLISRGSLLLAEADGSITLSCRQDAMLVPASVIKLATGLAAFEILGPDFRFSTSFYIDSQNNLYIKGSGDPFLVSEEVSLILGRLREKGLQRINNIYIDDSAYALEHQVPGRGGSNNPYDAPVGAMMVNFNSVQVVVDKAGKIHSGEPQTPLLPMMLELAQGKPSGRYRLNVCQERCDPLKQIARHSAELFRALQERENIPGYGSWKVKKIPEGTPLLYTHHNSRDITWLIGSMLHHSNNIIANSIYLACGVQEEGGPANWNKARQAVNSELTSLLGSETMQQLHMVEGSGLSRENRASAEAVLAILFRFTKHMDLMRKRGGIRLKSGTLEGVYNFAGYLPHRRPFVIMLNQRRNTRDEILARLRR